MKNIIRKILKEETSRHLPQDHPLIKTIKKMVGNEYEETFIDSWNEETYEYKITFDVPKISMWKVTDEDREHYSFKTYKPDNDSIWEGTIYVKVMKLKIFDSLGNVEFLDFDNIPDYSRRDFEDYISDTVAQWIPGANLDVSVDF
jgi:hypothetical protein